MNSNILFPFSCFVFCSILSPLMIPLLIGCLKEQEEDGEEDELERIDIPKSLLDTEKYCATLGHKGKL